MKSAKAATATKGSFKKWAQMKEYTDKRWHSNNGRLTSVSFTLDHVRECGSKVLKKKKEKEYIATQKNGISTHTHYLKGGAFEGLPRRLPATGWEAKEREGKKETPPRSNNNGAFITGYLFEVIYYFLVI